MIKSKIITAKIKIKNIIQDSFFFQIPGESTNHSEILKIALEKYSTKYGHLKADIQGNLLVMQWKPDKLDNSAEQIHQSAIKLAKEKHFDIAEKKWQQAIQMNPSDVEYPYKLGLLYFEQKRYQQSIDILNHVIEICPIHERAHLILGIAYIKLRKINRAEIHILHCRRLNHQNALAFLNLGAIYSIQRRFEDAIHMFQKTISLSPKEVRAYLGLGQIYAVLNDTENANEQFNKIIQIAPNSKIAETAKISIKTTDSAENVSRPDFVEVKKEEKIATGIGYYLAGDYKNAGNLYKDYLKFKPSDDFVWYLLSEAMLRVGKIEESADCLKKAIRTNPNRALYYKTLGIVLHQQAKTEEAIKIFKKAIELGKRDPLTHTLYGINLLRLKKHNEGIQQLQNILKKDPNNPLAMYHLSLALLKQKQNKKAEELVEKILSIKSDFPVKRQARALKNKL
ncbi:tetratricopeptide repeat protein [bacterium]|nr:tetratricopeptide repeat protein [bacterium]